MPNEGPLTQEQAQEIWNQLEREDAGVATAPEAPPVGGEPAADPPADGVSGEPDKSKSGTAGEPPHDEWAGVPQVLRDKITEMADRLGALGADRLDRIEAALNATVGRVGSIQSTLAKQAEMHKAATAAAATSQAAPSKEQIASAVKNPEKWDRLKADFPEWADGVAEFLEARLASLPKPEDTWKQPLEESGKRVEALEKNVATLAQSNTDLRSMVVEVKHKNWQGTVQSPAFRQWYAAQPQEVRALGASESPLDCIAVLDRYEEHRKQAPSPEEVARQRDERLKQATSPKGVRGAPPAKQWTDAEIAADPQGYWKYLDELDRQQVDA